MYIPSYSKLESREVVLDLIRTYSFATLIVATQEGIEAVHLPIVIVSEDPLVLAGHVAKANPIWKSFDLAKESLLIFLGPHAYISPTIYRSSPNVPTWNYAAVHVRGVLSVVADSSEVVDHLREMVTFFDPELPTVQPESLDLDYVARISAGVVVFKLKVTTVEAKHKMSQNKVPEDREGVISSLSGSDRQSDRDVADWMSSL